MKDIITELVRESDRVAAILGGSFVDGALDYVITNRLAQLKPGEESALFKPGGPLGSCDQKIKMAQALGLIGPRTKADLEQINHIRNIFAHNMNEVSFRSVDVKALCAKIWAGSEGHGTGDVVHDRERFVFAIQWIIVFMIEESNDYPQHKLNVITSHNSD